MSFVIPIHLALSCIVSHAHISPIEHNDLHRTKYDVIGSNNKVLLRYLLVVGFVECRFEQRLSISSSWPTSFIQVNQFTLLLLSLKVETPQKGILLMIAFLQPQIYLFYAHEGII